MMQFCINIEDSALFLPMWLIMQLSIPILLESPGSSQTANLQ